MAVRNLVVALTARTDRFQRRMKGARRHINQFERGVAQSARTLAKWGGAITVVAGGAGLGMLVKQSFSAIDAIAKTSDKLGIATEKLSAYHYAAKLSGLETRTFDMALQRMTRRVSEASHDTGEAKAAIKELGIDARLLGTMTPDKQLRVFADALQGVRSQSDRVRLAFKLFDSEGVSMIQMLGGGSRALDAYEAEARKLGQTFDRIDAGKIIAANNAILRMRGAFEGAFRSIAIEIAPFVETIADYFTGLAVHGEGSAKRIENAFTHAAEVAAKAGDTGAGVAGVGKSVLSGLQYLAGGASFLGSSVLNVARRWRPFEDPQTGKKVFGPFSKYHGVGPKGAFGPSTVPEGTWEDASWRSGSDLFRKSMGTSQSAANKFQEAASGASGQKAAEWIADIQGRADKNRVKAQFDSFFGGISKKYEAMTAAPDTSHLDSAAKSLMDKMRSPQEVFQKRVDALNELWRANKIGVETYNRAMLSYRKDLDSALDKMADLGEVAESAFDTSPVDAFNGALDKQVTLLDKLTGRAKTGKKELMAFGLPGARGARGTGGLLSALPQALLGGPSQIGGYVQRFQRPGVPVTQRAWAGGQNPLEQMLLQRRLMNMGTSPVDQGGLIDSVKGVAGRGWGYAKDIGGMFANAPFPQGAPMTTPSYMSAAGQVVNMPANTPKPQNWADVPWGQILDYLREIAVNTTDGAPAVAV